jgi:nucleoside-diphosphate-sugar epimerase
VARILVTGGAGFIGSHVTAQLLAAGNEVVVLDPLRSHGRPEHEPILRYRRETLIAGAELVEGSTEDKEKLRRVFEEFAPTSIVHLGVLPLATVALEDRQHAFESILHGTVNLLDLAGELGTIEKFVYISSSMVYGDFTQNPMPEDGQTQPKEIYGGMKLAGEIMTRSFGLALDVPFAICRISAVYGPGDVNARIVQKAVEAAVWKRPLSLLNPATTFLDFSYVGDVAQGLVKALVSPVENETFNITTGEARTLQDLCDLLQARYPDMPVTVEERASDFRPKRGTLDITKARTMIGYEPEFTLETGVATYLEFVESLPAPEPVAA